MSIALEIIAASVFSFVCMKQMAERETSSGKRITNSFSSFLFKIIKYHKDIYVCQAHL